MVYVELNSKNEIINLLESDIKLDLQTFNTWWELEHMTPQSVIDDIKQYMIDKNINEYQFYKYINISNNAFVIPVVKSNFNDLINTHNNKIEITNEMLLDFIYEMVSAVKVVNPKNPKVLDLYNRLTDLNNNVLTNDIIVDNNIKINPNDHSTTLYQQPQFPQSLILDVSDDGNAWKLSYKESIFMPEFTKRCKLNGWTLEYNLENLNLYGRGSYTVPIIFTKDNDVIQTNILIEVKEMN